MHFTDERVGLVAPRVASKRGASALARYEMSQSPLDLGPSAARVRAGTRVSYVPAAAIVCRVSALSAVGGFDDSMRLGEDVDLVWRLDEAGWRVRYEPSVAVIHRPRASLVAWLRQRYGYGTSAAPLAARHSGALAPLRISGWSAATWLAVAAGFPVIGGVIAASTTAMLARKLRNIPDGSREALRLAGLGHLFASRSIASALTRAWWPMAALAALVSKRARRVVIVAALGPALIEWVREHPEVDPLRYVGLRVLDDAAYGVGVLHGSARAKSIDALIPDLSSWPKTATSTTSAKH
jgi:mycofactocin system glycosyltransferase